MSVDSSFKKNVSERKAKHKAVARGRWEAGDSLILVFNVGET